MPIAYNVCRQDVQELCVGWLACALDEQLKIALLTQQVQHQPNGQENNENKHCSVGSNLK